MPFDLLDLVNKLGQSRNGTTTCHEIMREEAASLNKITPADVKKLFPNVEMGSSSQLVYVPLKMCHSMPKRNGRGRAFTAKTLSNSFASAKDALVNLDHEMKKVGGKSDRMIGHIVASRFDPDGKYLSEAASAVDSKVFIPQQPIPMLALAALSMRCEAVPNLIEEHLSGKRKWHTSMECGHNMEEASFYYRGEFIPVKDAEAGMRECVEKLSVRLFKGHELTLCLGGVDGFVDFWGMAMTPQPADTDSKVLAFISGDVFAEAANKSGKPFCFPLETKIFGERENKPVVLSVSADTRDSELANISILGTTEEADGHTHDILSDGTVVPANGHTHCLANWSIDRGTTPYFTGRTDMHYDYLPPAEGMYDRQSVAHMHMIDIALRGKVVGAKTEIVSESEESNLGQQDSEEASTEVTELLSELSNAISFSTGEVMDKIFAKMLAVLSSGKLDSAEAASLKNEIATFSQTNAIKDAVKAEIANLVAAGELYPKTAHEDAVKAAEAKAKAEADALLAIEKKKAERREEIMGLGLDPEAELEQIGGKKISEYIGAFGTDDQGELNYKLAFSSLKIIADAEKATLAAQTPTPEATKELQAAAANKGGKPAVPGTPAKKRSLLLVGAGAGAAGTTEEEASEGNAGEAPAKKLGKHAFSGV